MYFGGFNPTATSALTESWDGTNWTESGDLSTARGQNNKGGGGATNQPAMPDFADMMKNMMNPDMMQQMMNSMGGTQGLHQNNPNSREGQMRQKLQEKLQKKE